MPKPPAPVAGEATYFSGQLVASIHVGAEFRRPEGGGESGGRGEREGRGGRRGGGMSFGGGAGPMQFGGGEGGRGRGGPGGERGDGPPGELGGNSGGGPRMMPASGVPLMIHVKLRNTSAAPVEVACRDFASSLGNFVVQPATLIVPAGETAEFSPMTSFVQGDLPDELPVTLALRIAGKTEKQVVLLHPAPSEAPPPSER
ncbi:MAG: hypothetical protein HYV96_11735 [Opitutae bacterium]|nr:hypothetical protein [Opitutae bacterium]